MEFKGRIEIITGCMFSGKSTELLRRIKRAMIANLHVYLFKPHRDIRVKGRIKTHDDIMADAIEIPPDDGIIEWSSTTILKRRIEELEHVDVIAIDEFQFFDSGIVKLCNSLANSGIDVILAGLNTNFRGEPFGNHVANLMALADKIDLLDAICVYDGCNETATRTQRLVNGEPAKWDDPIILLGGNDHYQAVCRKHHRIDAPKEKQSEKQIKYLKNDD